MFQESWPPSRLSSYCASANESWRTGPWFLQGSMIGRAGSVLDPPGSNHYKYSLQVKCCYYRLDKLCWSCSIYYSPPGLAKNVFHVDHDVEHRLINVPIWHKRNRGLFWVSKPSSLNNAQRAKLRAMRPLCTLAEARNVD